MGDRLAEEVRAALNAADGGDLPADERAEMLMEIAVGLQRQPRSAEHIDAAIALYDRALALCPASQPLLAARITARRGTALQAAPHRELDALEEALTAYASAIPVLLEHGRPEEVAEAELNRGLVLQTLASAGRALITEAISAYQRALRAVGAYDEALKVRTRDTSPLEYANTLANKANCPWNLPDDVGTPELGNRQNLRSARAHYAEAREIFLEHRARDQARIVTEALTQIDREILATTREVDLSDAANPRELRDSQGGHS